MSTTLGTKLNASDQYVLQFIMSHGAVSKEELTEIMKETTLRFDVSKATQNAKGGSKRVKESRGRAKGGRKSRGE